MITFPAPAIGKTAVTFPEKIARIPEPGAQDKSIPLLLV
jgi:hypothetical protein